MIVSLQIKIYRAIIKEMSGPLAKWNIFLIQVTIKIGNISKKHYLITKWIGSQYGTKILNLIKKDSKLPLNSIYHYMQYI